MNGVFDLLARSLVAPPPASVVQPKASRRKEANRTAAMREALQAGRRTAAELAAAAGVRSGLVHALLKYDLAAGRVRRTLGPQRRAIYELVPPNGDTRPQPSVEAITWHRVEHCLPDDGITVLVDLVNSAEPVWLGYLDGGRWVDVDGMPIDVVAWAQMPAGGRR